MSGKQLSDRIFAFSAYETERKFISNYFTGFGRVGTHFPSNH